MSLLDAIIARDGCTELDALLLIKELTELVEDGADPADVLFDEGFEPDYLEDFLSYLE